MALPPHLHLLHFPFYELLQHQCNVFAYITRFLTRDRAVSLYPAGPSEQHCRLFSIFKLLVAFPSIVSSELFEVYGMGKLFAAGTWYREAGRRRITWDSSIRSGTARNSKLTMIWSRSQDKRVCDATSVSHGLEDICA